MLYRLWIAPAVLIALPLLAPVSAHAACEGVEVQVGDARQCLKPKDTFKDCNDCPEMVVMPAGSFVMGSSPADIAALAQQFGKDDVFLEDLARERQQRKVTIARPFAVGKFEVTFAEWEACVTAGGCKYSPEDFMYQLLRLERGKHPVGEVSWDDITKEYLPWLSRKTGKSYRLLTEAEWEYAARAGSTTRFHFGDDETDLCTYGNVADLTVKEKKSGPDWMLPTSQWTIANCRDGHAYTAPVGSFRANGFGLYDIYGNLWEWVQDCRGRYAGAPVDGSAVPDVPGCLRMARGGSWVNDARHARSASWIVLSPAGRGMAGFRLARTLPN
jgi:formylglycine-generating enzyme required for sulfatase activity